MSIQREGFQPEKPKNVPIKVRFPFAWNLFTQYSPWQALWGFVWNLTEYFHIGLGWFAPRVFGQMIGSKGKRRR